MEKVVITQERWKCQSGHLHRSEEIALRCEARAEARKDKPPKVEIDQDVKRRVQNERLAYVMKRRSEGAIFRVIGAEMGITAGRVRSMYEQALRRERNAKHLGLQPLTSFDPIPHDGTAWRRLSKVLPSPPDKE